MLFLPFPVLLAEIFIFIMAVKHWGFLYTLAFYFLPCLLGLLILTSIGRLTVVALQSALTRGEIPTNKLLHTGGVLLAGAFFLVPLVSTRIIGLILLLPGPRHLVVWRFKAFMARRVRDGIRGFNMGRGGFRFYSYRSDGQDFSSYQEERDVTTNSNILDVTPLKVTHEKKTGKPEDDDSL